MNVYFILFLSWLVPGLGHILLKRYWRGVIFFFSIVSMFLLGLYMGGRFFKPDAMLLNIIAWLADLGNGSLYFISKLLHAGKGNLFSVTTEFGTAYIAGAGLLNYLIALNAYDIAKGRKK